MSKTLGEGQLERIVKSTNGKLVCVDFWNKTCPPCVRSKPFWDSLPAKYKTCDFYNVICAESPGTAQNYGIRATPTFMFFLKGQKIGEIQGANEGQIISFIENHKPAGAFEGQGHTIGAFGSNEDYFAKICAKRDPDAAPKKKADEGCCKGGVCQIPQKQPKIDEDVVADLESMGFSAPRIQAALRATNYGTLEECMEWLESNQEAEESKPAETPAAPAEVAEAKKEEPAASAAPEEEPLAPLTPAGESMKAELLDMGFDEPLILKAIDYCDASSIDQALDYISKVQNGEEIPKKKKRLTAEEAKKIVAEARAKAKAAEEAAQSPATLAALEAKRRKEVQEEMARREIMEEQKRERELRERQNEKIREKLELERVKAKIRANREAQKREQNQAAQPKVATPAAAPKPKGPVTEATLQLVFPDNSKKVMKFKAADDLHVVERKIKEEIPTGGRMIVFSTTIPRADIPKSDWGKTLLELKLAPRSQLGVRFQ